MEHEHTPIPAHPDARETKEDLAKRLIGEVVAEDAIRRRLISRIEQWDSEMEYDAEDRAALADDILHEFNGPPVVAHPDDAASAGEPVAWLYRWKCEGEWTAWRVSDASQRSGYLKDLEEQPLYLRTPSEFSARSKASHRGDPCIYCGIGHNDVQPGPCNGDRIVLSRSQAENLLGYLKKGAGPAGWPTTLWLEVQQFISDVKLAMDASATPPSDPRLDRAVEALERIEGGHLPGITNKVLSGDWQGVFDDAQSEARQAIAAIRSGEA